MESNRSDAERPLEVADALPDETRTPLAVCAAALTLTDSLAWSLLDWFSGSPRTASAASGGGGLRIVKQSGFIEPCGAREWRVLPRYREVLLRTLARDEQYRIHSFLAGQVSDAEWVTSVDARSRALQATYYATPSQHGETMEAWLDLEQEARLEGALDQQKLISDLTDDLARQGWISARRPEVLYFRAMYLYSARSFKDSVPLFEALAGSDNRGRVVGIAKHCFGHLVLRGYAQPPGEAQSRVQAAEGLFYRAYEILRENDDVVGSVLVALALGKLLSDTGRAAKARALLTGHASEHRLPVGLRLAARIAAATAAATPGRHGGADHAEVLAELEAAAATARELREPELEAQALTAVAKIESARGHWERAGTLAAGVADNAERAGLMRSTCFALNQAGHAWLHLAGEREDDRERLLARARASFDRAIILARELRDPSIADYQAAGLARVHTAMGDVVTARSWYEQLIRSANRRRDWRALSIGTAGLADLLGDAGAGEEALYHLRLALAQIGRSGTRNDVRQLEARVRRLTAKKSGRVGVHAADELGNDDRSNR